MKRTQLCFLLIIIFGALALGQEQQTTKWTDWLPASNPTYRDQYGIEHERTHFVYRWRLSTPCSNKDCSIAVQIRNNSDTGASVNYAITIERADGSLFTDKDHWNFGPYETRNASVDSYGVQVNGVKIEVT
jgi:hypothetical protein